MNSWSLQLKSTHLHNFLQTFFNLHGHEIFLTSKRRQFENKCSELFTSPGTRLSLFSQEKVLKRGQSSIFNMVGIYFFNEKNL